jgi:hypothetical protein
VEYRREEKEYHPELSNNSKKDQKEGWRLRVSDCGGYIQDSSNNRRNADNIREGNIPHGFLAAVEHRVPNPGLVPSRNGFGQKTVRYFRINFDIVKFVLFVV